MPTWDEVMEAEQRSSNSDHSQDLGYFVERLRERALSTEQLRALPQPPWIIDGLLQADSLAEVYGKPGTYKSFLAAAWAQHVTSGLWWQGLAVKPGPVLYVIAEGAAGMGVRVDAWQDYHHERLAHGDSHSITWVPMAVALGNPTWGLAVGNYAAELDARLVVFDTRARNTVGLEENSARDMGLVVAHLDAARELCRACILLVHHANAMGDKSRGSTAVEGAVDTELSVKVADGLVTLKLEKQKNGPDGTSWSFRPEPVLDSVVLVASEGRTDEVTAAGHAMLGTLRAIHVGDPVSWSRWLKACEDVSESSFARQLRLLLKRGDVVKDGRGYTFPPQVQP